eukprot:6143809-Pyramimonas_sp.AAC.1
MSSWSGAPLEFLEEGSEGPVHGVGPLGCQGGLAVGLRPPIEARPNRPRPLRPRHPRDTLKATFARVTTAGKGF